MPNDQPNDLPNPPACPPTAPAIEAGYYDGRMHLVAFYNYLVECHKKGMSDRESRIEEWRRSGRPYISLGDGPGFFQYINFDLSQPLTPETTAQFEALAKAYGLLHRHHVENDRNRGVFDVVTGTPKDWSHEEIQLFVDELAHLLPHFDRPAVISCLVTQAIEAGYFHRRDVPRTRDRYLMEDAVKAYDGWCRDHNRPSIVYKEDERAFQYKVFEAAQMPSAIDGLKAIADTLALELHAETDEDHPGSSSAPVTLTGGGHHQAISDHPGSSSDPEPFTGRGEPETISGDDLSNQHPEPV